jgi:formylglycine-generating enzyme required for sulfatase activity
MPETHADIRIRIRAFDRASNAYPVEATLHDGSFFDGGRFQPDQEALLVTSIDQAAYGQFLFDSLVTGSIRDAYSKALALAQGKHGGRLRVRLWIDQGAGELQVLHWERLHHLFGGKQVPIATTAITPFSRFAGRPEGWPTPLDQRPIRMLAALSNPLDTKDAFRLDPVAVEEEVEALIESLADARAEGLLSITVLPGRTSLSPALKTELIEEGIGVIDGSLTLDHLLRHLPGHHVLHLLGHGLYKHNESRGILFLEHENGTYNMVDDGLFVASLVQIAPLPQLVFLVACESSRRDTADGRPFVGVGPKLVEAGVPAVIAMQDRVSMTTTRQLATDFYSLLFRHEVVDQAMNEARNLLRSRGLSDWSVPVLFMRLKDGRLFDFQRVEPVELAAYLDKALPQLENQALGKLIQEAIPEEPYKGLYAFEIDDRAIFFGREQASDALTRQVLHQRLTVLQARSGAGKTSLLNAGLMARLIRQGRVPISVRSYQDPALAIRRAIAVSMQEPRPELLLTLDLQEFLRLACSRLGSRFQELVILLDQFEEFFIFTPGRDQRQPFIEQLAACYHDTALPIRIVISLREDYVAHLAELETRIPTIFYNQHRLEPMSREQVKVAITEPVRVLHTGVTYEPALLDQLLLDLASDDMELPHLQIICRQLFEELPEAETQITLQAYEKAGKAGDILGGYLDKVLKELGDGAGIGKEVLKELVSSEATRRVRNQDYLVGRVEAQPEKLEAVLGALVRKRILRRHAMEGQVLYEMAHEYLVPQIMKWIDREEMPVKQAEELLAREMASWRAYGSSLIPTQRLSYLYPHREQLMGLDLDTDALILISVLFSEQDMRNWISFAHPAAPSLVMTRLLSTQESSMLGEETVANLAILIAHLPAAEQLGLLSQPEMPATLKLAIWEILDQRSDLPTDTLVSLSTGPDLSPELKLRIWEALDQRSDLPANTLVNLLTQADMPPDAKLKIWEALHRHRDLPTETVVDLLADPGLPPRVRNGIADDLGQRGFTRPGVGLADNGLPDIVWCPVPAGRFVMGEGESRRELLLQPFAISKYPITNAQYEAFVLDGGYAEKWQHCWTEAGWHWKKGKEGPAIYGGAFDLADHPVAGVSWYEAQAFTRWLSEKLGMQIFLPSEAQWEKASRSSDGRRYPWGEEITPNHANYKLTGIGNTSAVGIFSEGASPYGILDMGGNVWEWCLTKWREDYTAGTDNDPEGDADRVLRGGSFYSDTRHLRCAARKGGKVNYRIRGRGFRAGCASPSTVERSTPSLSNVP